MNLFIQLQLIFISIKEINPICLMKKFLNEKVINFVCEWFSKGRKLQALSRLYINYTLREI